MKNSEKIKNEKLRKNGLYKQLIFSSKREHGDSTLEDLHL
jgi:hypothetical protein